MPIRSNVPLEYKIIGIDIDVRAQTIDVKVTRGITVNGVVELLKEYTIPIGSVDTQALMAIPTTSGTIYSSLKNALQEYLLNSRVVDGNAS